MHASQTHRPPAPANIHDRCYAAVVTHGTFPPSAQVIVDKSGSMAGARWKEARECVAQLAPHVCKCDPDGITLYFFGSHFTKYSNVKSSEDVIKYFSKESPGGSTDLAAVLADAVQPGESRKLYRCPTHVSPSTHSLTHPPTPRPPARPPLDPGEFRPETILVITDGEPDSKPGVSRVIIEATKKQKKDEDLSISFIQVGNDSGADRWLGELDDGLKAQGATFDIVDKITHTMLKGKSFRDLIASSVSD
jgi:hypothetical protein